MHETLCILAPGSQGSSTEEESVVGRWGPVVNVVKEGEKFFSTIKRNLEGGSWQQSCRGGNGNYRLGLFLYL